MPKFGSLRRTKKSRTGSVDSQHDENSSKNQKKKVPMSSTTEQSYPDDEFDEYPIIEDHTFPG